MNSLLILCRSLRSKVAVSIVATFLSTAPLVAVEAGEVLFDTFAGANTDAKIVSMNAWSQARPYNDVHPTVVFSAGTYTFSTPIQLWSGLSIRGEANKAAREYTTGTVLKWTGAANTSMFAFTGSQPGQGYPANGAPRDIHMESLLFEGTSTTHFFPKQNLGGSVIQANVLWYGRFHNVGWKTWNTIYWGWMTGTTISGATHVQTLFDTGFFVGGSENNLFSDEYCFADTSNTTAQPNIWSQGLPFFISKMDKSKIGRIMFTSRKGGYALKIEFGNNLVVEGAAFDAQSSDPANGSAISITGGEGIRILGCSFKGHMMAGAASGTANRGWINITGGRQIVIDGNSFLRAGDNPAPTTTPLVWVSSAVANNEVKWGLNASAGYAGAGARVGQAAAGKIVNIDPSVTVALLP